MKTGTVIKLGVTLSVVLFCIAVGFYAFTQLSLTDRNKDINLYTIVPAEGCIGLLESDNILYYQDALPQLNYRGELVNFRFPGLFNYLLGGLNEYTAQTVHGLSGRMNSMLVSFHAPGTMRDQVVYYRLGEGDEQVFDEILRGRAPNGAEPKKEKHEGKTIHIYPLESGEFLAVYKEAGFFVASYQKRLIEQVIETREDSGRALVAQETFARAVEKKKAHNYLTLYARTAALPLLQDEGCWSEFDFYMNSDVVYLTGEMFANDTCRVERLAERWQTVSDVREDSVFVSANPETMAAYMDEVSSKESHTLFDECVVNLSRDADFMLVVDMEQVVRDPERFRPYLPPYLMEYARFFHSFILSVQLTEVNGRLSHIFVLTYKK